MVIVSGIDHFAGDLFLRLVAAMALQALRAAAERGDRTLALFVGGQRGDQRQAAAALFGRRARRTLARLRAVRGCRGAGSHVDLRPRRLRLRPRQGAPQELRPAFGSSVSRSSLRALFRLRRNASWLPASPSAWFPRRDGGASSSALSASSAALAFLGSIFSRATRRAASSSAILRSSTSRTESASASARAHAPLRQRGSRTPPRCAVGAAGPQVRSAGGRRRAWGGRRRRGLVSTTGGPPSPGRRRFGLLDDHRFGAAVAEALAHDARLARGLSERVFEPRPSFLSPGVRFSHQTPKSLRARSPASSYYSSSLLPSRRAHGPEIGREHGSVTGTSCRPDPQAALHLSHLSCRVPNPIRPN